MAAVQLTPPHVRCGERPQFASALAAPSAFASVSAAAATAAAAPNRHAVAATRSARHPGLLVQSLQQQQQQHHHHQQQQQRRRRRQQQQQQQQQQWQQQQQHEHQPLLQQHSQPQLQSEPKQQRQQRSGRECRVTDLSCVEVPYEVAWQWQKDQVARRLRQLSASATAAAHASSDVGLAVTSTPADADNGAATSTSSSSRSRSYSSNGSLPLDSAAVAAAGHISAAPAPSHAAAADAAAAAAAADVAGGGGGGGDGGGGGGTATATANACLAVEAQAEGREWGSKGADGCGSQLDGSGCDQLLVLQHAAVYTMGTRSSQAHLKFDPSSPPAPLHVTERGGEVTYHGPGQVVLYPILDLRRHKMDLHWYLRALEETVMVALERAFGIKGERVPGMTGVWADGRKLAAIGVRVSKWVTFHGVALNVCTDLSAFDRIVPCGLTLPVGSVKDHLFRRAERERRQGGAVQGVVLAGAGGASGEGQCRGRRGHDGDVRLLLGRDEGLLVNKAMSQWVLEGKDRALPLMRVGEGVEGSLHLDEECGGAAQRAEGDGGVMVAGDNELLRVAAEHLMAAFSHVFDLDMRPAGASELRFWQTPQ